VAWLGLGQALAQLRRQTEALAAYQQALAAQQAHGQQHLVIRTLSAMAASALQQGDLVAALQHVEAILSGVDLATTEEIHEPLACALICYQVLQSNGDARADRVLRITWQRLQSQVITIDDEKLRRSFLEKVEVNRTISALNTKAPQG
jgi:hypothetical protein